LQDDEAELLAELERIKRERAEEAAKAAAEAAAKRSAEEQAELIRGNPLLQEKLAAQGARSGGSQLTPVPAPVPVCCLLRRGRKEGRDAAGVGGSWAVAVAAGSTPVMPPPQATYSSASQCRHTACCLPADPNFALKRRWDDDVVFK
jgi:hypothetical protein